MMRGCLSVVSEERNQNLLKVATCIVKRQQAFEQGVMAMQPMVLKDVAIEVGT